MNKEKLQYILEVAKTHSITDAARNLHISQAAISKAIAVVEKKYGITLFNRSRNGSYPTAKGKKVIEIAADLLMNYNTLEKVLRGKSEHVSSTIKLSATSDAFINILPNTIISFKEKKPSVSIEISEKDAKNIVADLKLGIIDIGLSSLNEDLINDVDLSFEILFESNMHVYVSKKSSLANYKMVTPLDLVNRPIVLFNGINMKSFFEKLTKSYGPLNISFTTNNPELIKKTIVEDHAITFAPNISMLNDPYIVTKEIISIPLTNHFSGTRYFGWLSLKKQPLSENALDFITELKRQLHNN